jgi:hypothetical protein
MEMQWLTYVCYVGIDDGVAPKHVEYMVYENCNAGSDRKKKYEIGTAVWNLVLTVGV